MVKTIRRGGAPGECTAPDPRTAQRPGREGTGEMAGGSRKRHERVIPLRMTETRGIHRHRLCPAEADDEEEKRSHGIEMGKGIEGETPRILRRIIPQPVRRVRMGTLVDCNRNEDGDDVRGTEEGNHKKSIAGILTLTTHNFPLAYGSHVAPL